MIRRFPIYSIIAILLAAGSFSSTHAQFIQTARGTMTATAYCATSTVCGSTPEYFDKLLTFVTEMLNSIKTMGTEGDYVGKYVNPNRFKGTEFDPPVSANTMVNKVVDNAEQKFKFTMATTAILTNPFNVAGLKDAMGNTILTSKNKVFMRDNQYLQEAESLLDTKKYELGLGGGRYNVIIPENIAIMNDIIASYEENGLLETSSNITYGATYTNIISVLTQLLSAAKTFLYFDSTSQLAQTSRGHTKANADKALIVLTSDAMLTIKNDYDCARGFLDVCDKNKTTFKTIRKTIVQKFKSSPYETKEVFNNALLNLRSLFSKSQQTDEYKANKDELLQAAYGQSSRGTLIDVSTGQLDEAKDAGTAAANDAQAIGEAGVVVGQTLGAVGSSIGKSLGNVWKSAFNKDVRDAKKKAKEDKKNNVPSVSDATSAVGDDLSKNILISYVQDVFDQQTDDKQAATLAEIKTITPAFLQIGDQIAVIKDQIIGTKDDESSLIKNLKDAADTQCGR